MTRMMLIDAAQPDETRVVITDEQGEVDHFDFVTKAKMQLKGNIYLGKITRVEPSLQAAFVEYGAEKQGFLPFSEIHPDYYQIPVEDRQKLLEEAAALEEENNARLARESQQQAEVTSETDEDDQPDAADDNEASDDNNASDETVDDEEEEGETRAPNKSRRRGRRKNFTSRAVNTHDDDTIVSEPVEQHHITDIDDDEADEVRKRRTPITRRYKIQEVIKPGQIILVQVIKEERGNKGVSLSSYMSLAGRYCVLMPNSPKDGGISRKIASHEDRKRLKQISGELKDARGMSAIIRTAGIDRTKAEIKRDYDYLIKLWNQVREDALASIAPAAVYEENDIIKRSIRDHHNADIERIYVEGEASYKQAKAFMKMLMPSHAPRVKHYKDTQPIFVAHQIEPTLNALYKTHAPLKSGGYLVINPTEALISIDVNSGRSTNERNVEETAYRTNLEAAAEAARQLRLRNLGGLIVIDFIDMNYGKHRRNVERAMKDALKADRARVQNSQISSFGLMELSRQRMGASLEETTTHACNQCQGTGKVMLPEATMMQLLRNLQSYVQDYGNSKIDISLSPALMQTLLNEHRAIIDELQKTHQVTLQFSLSDNSDHAYYHFKSSKGPYFNSTDTPALSKSSRNSRASNTNGANARRDNTKSSADKPSRSERTPRRDRTTRQPRETQPETLENTDVPGVEVAASSEEKPKRSRRRGGRNRNKKHAETAATKDENIQDNVQQAAAEIEVVTDNSAEKPVDKETGASSAPRKKTRTRRTTTKSSEDAQQPQKPDDTTTLQNKVLPNVADRGIQETPAPMAENDNHLQDSAIAPQTKNTQDQDTPAPKKRRKGWWQRVSEA